MEGGLYPWKTQRIVDNSPDISYFSKSLPSPPSGHFWERKEDGNWTLVKIPTESAEEGTILFPNPSIIEHTVMPGDTLQGICLRYRVNATEIRRANLFSGNSIQFKQTLLIPINGGCIVRPQIETHDILVQRFKNVTQEGTTEARIYLEENNWDIVKAIHQWRNDAHWEGENKDNEALKAYFSLEIPAEDTVMPAKIELAKEVRPICVTFEPPTESMLQSSSKIYDLEVGEVDPAAMPLLG